MAPGGQTDRQTEGRLGVRGVRGGFEEMRKTFTQEML